MTKKQDNINILDSVLECLQTNMVRFAIDFDKR